MIQAKGIEKSFGTLKVLKGIDFNAEKAEVVSIMAALNALGYDCGDADGIAGKKTLAGIAAFVDAHDTDGEDVPDEAPSTGECYIVIGGRKFKGDIEEV